jgi:hypothetical protein
MKDMKLIEALTLICAERLMEKNGYSREKDSPNEWDTSRYDSQYSMCLEEAEFVVDTVLSTLKTIELEDLEEEEEETPQSAITTSTAIFIFCDAGYGNPLYVSDVREWLRQVDEAGVPDDCEVDGTLHLSFDIRDNPRIERIECGGCGHKDVLITEHCCEETERGT